MASFDDFLNLTKETAEKVGKKTGDLIEVSKLRLRLSTAERELSTALEGLGRLVYDAGKSGEDISEMTASAMTHLDELTEKAEQLRAEIDNCKNRKRCPNCGAVNTEDAIFCKQCGTKL